MVNQLSTNNFKQVYPNDLNFSSNGYYPSANVALPFANSSVTNQIPGVNIKELREQARKEIPIARNLEERKENPFQTFTILALGLVLGPLFSKMFQNISSPDGFLVRVASYISDHTKFVDKSSLVQWFGKTNESLLKRPNFKTYVNGLRKMSLLSQAEEEIAKLQKVLNDPLTSAKKLAKTMDKKISLNNSADVLKKSEEMGLLGKWFAKSGIILKNNTSGMMKYVQGLMAAMTINNVIQAKKGEKTSTLMQELLGNWIGNIYGFKFVQKYVISGIGAFVDAAKNLPKDTKTVGILPKIGKILSFVPGPIRGLFSFLLPLGGAFLFSWAFQKLSHKLFGKPSSELPNQDKNEVNPSPTTNLPAQNNTIQKSNELSSWLAKTGWSMATHNENSLSVSANKPANSKPGIAVSSMSKENIEHNKFNKGTENKKNSKDNDPDYYMPSPELLPKIVEKYTGQTQQNLDAFDKEISWLADDLERVGVHI